MADVLGPGEGSLTLSGAAGRTEKALAKCQLIWILQCFHGTGTMPGESMPGELYNN